MKPSVRIHGLVDHINNSAKLLGLDLLADELKFITHTWITACAPVSYAIFGSYWAIKEAQRHWMEGLKSSIMLGGLVNGTMKLLTVLMGHPLVRGLFFYIIDIFAQYENRGPAYLEALNMGIDRMLRIRSFIRIGYLLAFMIMLMVPLVLLFHSGTRTTIMQYEIPGLDIQTDLGYALTYLQHMLPEIVGGIGFYTGDMMVLLALVQILTFAHIFQLKAEELNDALCRKEQSRHLARVGGYTDHGIQELLIDLIKWHQVFINYYRTVEDIYHNMIAAQVLGASAGILICVCVNLNGFHLISAIFLLVSAYSMIVYCVVGTQIEFAYDQVYDSLCILTWQEFDCEQRKLFVLMLKAAQSTKIMSMLGVLPLSLGTALQLMKLIYSMSMMMMRNRN